MSEAGEPTVGGRGFVDEADRDLVEWDASLASGLQAALDQLHAARTGAAVLVADGQNAGCDRRRQRLPVARNRQASRRTRRRAGAMIRDADEDRVHQPAFTNRG